MDSDSIEDKIAKAQLNKLEAERKAIKNQSKRDLAEYRLLIQPHWRRHLPTYVTAIVSAFMLAATIWVTFRTNKIEADQKYVEANQKYNETLIEQHQLQKATDSLKVIEGRVKRNIEDFKIEKSGIEQEIDSITNQYIALEVEDERLQQLVSEKTKYSEKLASRISDLNETENRLRSDLSFARFDHAINQLSDYPSPLNPNYEFVRSELEKNPPLFNRLVDTIKVVLCKSEQLDKRAIGNRLLIDYTGNHRVLTSNHLLTVLDDAIEYYQLDSGSTSVSLNFIQTFSYALSDTFRIVVIRKLNKELNNREFNTRHHQHLYSIVSAMINDGFVFEKHQYGDLLSALSANLQTAYLDKLTQPDSYFTALQNVGHLCPQVMFALYCEVLDDYYFQEKSLNKEFTDVILRGSTYYMPFSKSKYIKSMMDSVNVPTVMYDEDPETFLTEWNIFLENNHIEYRKWIDPKFEFFRANPNELHRRLEMKTF